MKRIKWHLACAGFVFATSAYAQTPNVDQMGLSEDAAILLFNEGEGQNVAEMTSGPDADGGYLNCASEDYRANRCRVPGRVQSVTLVRRFSNAPCIAGRTFGAGNRFVWVDNGCAGQFYVQFRRGW